MTRDKFLGGSDIRSWPLKSCLQQVDGPIHLGVCGNAIACALNTSFDEGDFLRRQ